LKDKEENTMNDPIVTALKARYRSPYEVMKKLGLDAALLRQPCRDEGEEELSPTDKLRAIFASKYTPDQVEALMKIVAQIPAAGGDDEGEERRADNDRRDLGDEFEDDAEDEVERIPRRSSLA
jgi:hypothetical protein